MQVISPIAASTAVRIRSGQHATDPVETPAGGESRAVIPLRPIAAGEAAVAARRYPLAGFLAHLIAIRERAPQTRRRGRATPGDAVAAYAATQRPTVSPAQYRKSA
jgi:hypothetical protein